MESFFPEIDVMIFPILLFIVSIISVFFFNKKIGDRLIGFKHSYILITVAILINFFVTFSYINSGKSLLHWQAKAIYPSKYQHSYDNSVRSLNYFIGGILYKKITRNDLPETILSEKPVLVEKLPDRNIIFVVGESLRWDKLSINGYEVNTTPFIDSLSSTRSVLSKNIYSGGTMTKTSFNTLLNRIKQPCNDLNMDNNLFKLAKNNGFITWFISNQTEKELSVIDNILGKKFIDFYYNKEDIQTSLDSYTSLDEDLVSMLSKINLNDNNFIVLHQKGSHSPYRSYSEEFGRFNEPYDNTVLYTDSVLKGIYDYLKKKSDKPTFMVFTSDHGELLNGKESRVTAFLIRWFIRFLF
ncbi:MAG: phosphoethanolamine transferase [Candidatus Delongbacteria bacterium]|nr:phosphoethanolamine transferase [Candidatus Delongbacteria bacterium]